MGCKMMLTLAAWLWIGMHLRGETAAGGPSLAMRTIARLEAEAARQPAQFLLRNELAQALVRRADETGDPALLDRAEEQLKESLRLSPGNFGAERLQARITFLKGRSEAALVLARPLNKRVPDDLETYSLLVQIYASLGKLEDAEKQAQWMLDMRPESPLSLARGAELRERFGDLHGAMDMLNEAYRRFPESDTVERANLLVVAARIQKRLGEPSRAAPLLREAARILPESEKLRRLAGE